MPKKKDTSEQRFEGVDSMVLSEKSKQLTLVDNKNEVRSDTHVFIHSVCYSTNIY